MQNPIQNSPPFFFLSNKICRQIFIFGIRPVIKVLSNYKIHNITIHSFDLNTIEQYNFQKGYLPTLFTLSCIEFITHHNIDLESILLK